MSTCTLHKELVTTETVYILADIKNDDKDEMITM